MGGATMSLFYIIEKLDRSKYYPIVLFLSDHGAGIDFFKKMGIEVIVSTDISWYAHAENARYKILSRRPFRSIGDIIRIPGSIQRLKDIFTKYKPDLVHLNTSLLIPAAIAAKKCGLKVVWHIREPLYKGFLGIRRRFIRNIITRYADAIIAISQEDGRRIGNNVKSLSVIYNYIDFKRFDKNIDPEPLRTEFGIHSENFVVCNLGGVVHSKGPDVFLKAAAIVLEEYPKVKFIMVGYPPEAILTNSISKVLRRIIKRDINFEVIKLIKQYPILNSVVFTGIRNDIPEILSLADVLVWSATLPHFARPIIEAGAMAKPVIASDFINSRELVDEGKNGFLVEPGNPKVLADRIIEAYLNKERLFAMGDHGYLLAKSHFNADINFEKILSIYKKLLSE
ncbi:MAG: glycosyltransferase family 4 protein [Cyclobacteriaceae bacterium]|nr:glycosyltransferase family 4 protein [Cyclobacteriaceae bacterium]